MLRIHDRLRKLHQLRLQRRRRIHISYDPTVSLGPYMACIREVEAMGYLDPAFYDGFEDAIVGTIMANIKRLQLVKAGAQHLSDNVLGDRIYRLSLARQIGTGCNALAIAAMEERVLLAAVAVIRDLARLIHEEEPALPSPERIARAVAEGVMPRQYEFMRDRGLLRYYHDLREEHPDWSMAQLSDALDPILAQRGLKPKGDDAGDGAGEDGGEGDDEVAAEASRSERDGSEQEQPRGRGGRFERKSARP